MNDEVVNPIQDSVKHFPVQTNFTPAAKISDGLVKQKTNSQDFSSRQTLLLGVGLAAATMALIAVLLAFVYLVMRPLANGPARIKATESGKKIIVVDQ